jgi:hypothetical protein
MGTAVDWLELPVPVREALLDYHENAATAIMSRGRSPFWLPDPAAARIEPRDVAARRTSDMSRTVIYRTDDGPVVFGPGDTPADGYVDKLIKYVPAEVVAFFAPAAAIAAGSRGALLGIAAAGVIATPGYLWYQSRKLPVDRKPLPHFFVIATIAFLVWAAATSPALASTAHLETQTVTLLLMVTILFVPLVDAGCTQLWLRLRGKA